MCKLRRQGYIAEYIQEQDILLISSSLDMNALSLKLNDVFDLIGHPEHKLFANDESPSTRSKGVTCTHASDYYHVDHWTCVNYLCIADSSYSLLWYYDCYDGTCYAVTTTCFSE